jgi:hypothetical protein
MHIRLSCSFRLSGFSGSMNEANQIDQIDQLETGRLLAFQA